ncbi:MAG TPA: M12 family metallo-peptidase [Thermoanaerobaculia bacterium]
MGLATTAAAMENRVEQSAFAALNAPVAKGAKLRLSNIPFADANTPQALELESFEVWAPDAEIEVFGENGKVTRVAPPAVRYFRGGVAGDADSYAFVSIDERGRVGGLVVTQDRRYEIQTRQTAGRPGGTRHRTEGSNDSVDIFISEVATIDDADTGFKCEVESREIGMTTATPSTGISSLSDRVRAEAVLSGTQTWALNLALETDYELFVAAGSSEANVRTYVGNLIAAVSTIYRRDLSTDLFIAYLGVHTTVSDPFTVVPGSTRLAMDEFAARWHNTPPSNTLRSSALLLSGKSQMSGIAWVGTICQGDYDFGNNVYAGAYAYCGGIQVPASLVPPSPTANAPTYTLSNGYWPVLQVAHELGHNVGSHHTHCVALTGSDPQTYGRQWVDVCYSGDFAGNTPCYNGAQSVPAEKGTIMSYCHLLGGSNSRFVFGKTGEASYVIPNNMKGYIQAKTPSMSAITAPASVNIGTAANASVANGGLNYLWTITNGTINGPATGNAVSFTATANPVTLKVKATNASGCAVSDSITVQAQTSCTTTLTPPTHTTISYLGQVLNIGVTSNCAWTATSNVPWISFPLPNGNGNGTVEVQVSSNAQNRYKRTGTITIAGQQIVITQWSHSNRADFNGDARIDLVLRNHVTGENKIWIMNRMVMAQEIPLPSEPDLNWKIHGVGDFSADGFEDIVWRNPVTGDMRVWFMRGSQFSHSEPLKNVHPVWELGSVFRYYDDGTDNLAFRNASNGGVVMWFMTGTTLTSTTTLPSVTDLNWKFRGMADFNRDTWSDLVWHNSSTNWVVIWFLVGTNKTTTTGTGYISSSQQLVATGDFDWDGSSDMIWRDPATGVNTLWLCASGYNFAAPPFPSAGLNWSIVGPR